MAFDEDWLVKIWPIFYKIKFNIYPQ